MPKNLSERILEHIREPGYRPLRPRSLAKALQLADEEYGEFRDVVRGLARVGRVVIGSDSSVLAPQAPPTVIGTYRANPRGFGFVVPDEPTAHGDLFIAPGDSLDALTGDTVRCRVMKRQRDGKTSLGGQVIEVVQRGHNRFVGQLASEGGSHFVQTDGNTLHVPIFIGDPGAKGAKVGDQVVVEIVRYPQDGKPAQGVIVERLGQRGDRGVDLLSIVYQHNLPSEFPPEAMADARSAIERFDPDAEANVREDLSGEVVITIDPDTARDFDDAISLKRLSGESRSHTGKKSKSGGGPSAAAWELGVHIADVSHFVRTGGPLDEEAVNRGTSVYFPGHVIPMLPEVLSNGVCSLQEAEPRLCKSAFIQYDDHGRVVDARFANTIIRSTKRLTYEQAGHILDGKIGKLPKPVVALVRDMDTLAKAIRQRRLGEGMVVLDLPEVQLEFDDNERVIDAHPAESGFSHTIIEMFMVEANEAVARHLRSLGAPFLRRIHPDPDAESIEGVVRFLRAAGHPIPKRFSHADLQALLAEVRGKPESYAVSLAVLKSMETAEYSPKDIGHFALASECYAHFTSPIRRYPDLMIHRLLQQAIDGEWGKRRVPASAPTEEDLGQAGRDLSFKSRRAESAEREYKQLKVLQLLEKHVGESFEGVITGVAQFGMFVQYPKYLIDGLIHMDDLGDDWWEVDVRTGRVHGKRTRRTFAMGQVVTAVIDSIDLAARQLNLALAGVQRAAPRSGGSGDRGGRSESGGGRRRPRGGSEFTSKRSFGEGRSAGKTGRRSGGGKPQRGGSHGQPRRGRKGKGGRRR